MVDEAAPLVPPWQDPEQTDFWRARTEDQHLTVNLSQRATEVVWRMYKHRAQVGFVPITYEGEIHGQGAALDFSEAVRMCKAHRVFVYNLHRRRAWRIVWHHPRVEQRTTQNHAFEAVEVMGYKGLSDQWKDRPRAKLFANDF